MCDVGIFACGSIDNCQSSNFTMAGGREIVLRPAQVTALQTGSEALTISPSTTLSVVDAANRNEATATSTNCTATATETKLQSQNNTGAAFTAGQLAGTGAGIGVPLLLALLGAGVVIYRQHNQLKSLVPSKASVPASHSQWDRSMGQYYQPVQQHSNFAEHVPEVSGADRRLEMDTAKDAQELDGGTVR